MTAPELDDLGPARTPQELVLDLLGLHALGRADTTGDLGTPVPTRVFLDVLGQVGASPSAVRTTLSRMVNRGELARHRSGRTSAFGPSPGMVELLQRGRARVFSQAPFDHAGDQWTILSCPVPESMRNLRYHLQVRLSWAGFGALQSGLWVAPGAVDVDDLLGERLPADARGLVHAFHGTPAAPTTIQAMIESAWSTDDIRAAHELFLARWAAARSVRLDPLPEFLLLVADWGRLLRIDPGLPGSRALTDWPSGRSTRLFQRLDARLGPRAEAQLRQLVEQGGE